MLELLILFGVALYVLISVVFVKIVKKMAPNNERYRRLAIALVVLLPTWDIVLGYLVYFPSCYFVPKAAIYETAVTDGIYYEGDYKNVLVELSNGTMRVSTDDVDLKKGFKYVEALVDKKYDAGYKSIPPVIYHCSPLPKDPQNPQFTPAICEPASQSQNDYMVIVKKTRFGVAEIRFMKIRKRSTGTLMAEYNEVALMDKNNFISFIDATQVGEGGSIPTTCPKKSRFYDFQYDVLKPKH